MDFKEDRYQCSYYIFYGYFLVWGSLCITLNKGDENEMK